MHCMVREPMREPMLCGLHANIHVRLSFSLGNSSIETTESITGQTRRCLQLS